MREEKTKPVTSTELRHFGMLFSLILVALFGVTLPWLFDARWPVWPWSVGGVMMTLALAWPRGLAPIYRIWMRFGLIAGFVNTRIIMFLLYYGVFAPVALLMRIAGRDALARSAYNEKMSSYRVNSTRRPKDHFERPY